MRKEPLMGNPAASIAVVSHSGICGTVWLRYSFLCRTQLPKIIRQIDQFYFRERASLLWWNHQVASYPSKGVVNTAVVFMPMLFLSLLYPTLCCIQLFSEMLSVKNDFYLTDFQFLRCNVAWSYLVERVKIVFCHCTKVKTRHPKILGNLVSIWN